MTTSLTFRTIRELAALAAKEDRWVFDKLIPSSVTTLYGKSNVGKSYLVASMLLSLALKDRDFLGLSPTDPYKEWRPTILCTDPGAATEYGERIAQGLPDGIDPDIDVAELGVTRTQAEWSDIVSELVGRGRNFVVVDNLMGVTGDSNDVAACSVVYEGAARLISKGVPVVILHHESEHGGSRRGAPPMGASVIVQKSRAWIQVRQTERKGLRGGNTGLYIQGNGLDQPYEIIAEPGVGPTYQVIQRNAASSPEPLRTGPPTEGELLEWVSRHGEGKSERALAKDAVDHFGFLGFAAYRKRIADLR